MRKITNLIPVEDAYKVKDWELYEVGDRDCYWGDSNHSDCLPGTEMVVFSGLISLGTVRAVTALGALEKGRNLITEAMGDYQGIDYENHCVYMSDLQIVDGKHCVVATVYDSKNERRTSEFFILPEGSYKSDDHNHEVIEVPDDFEI